MFPLHILNSMLRGAPSSNTQVLALTAGQVIKGEVIKFFNEEQLAMVRLGSVQVQAKLEAPLAVGEKSWFQVQSSSQPITLRLISAPQLPLLQGQSDLSQLLQFFGLKPSVSTEKLVQFFLNENLPMSRQELRSGQEIVKRLGTKQSTLEAIKIAVQKGLPLSREVVQSVKAYTHSPSLMQQINSLEKLLPTQLKTELKAWTTKLAQDIVSKPGGLQSFLQRLGVQLESNMAKGIVSQIQPSSLASSTTNLEVSSLIEEHKAHLKDPSELTRTLPDNGQQQRIASTREGLERPLAQVDTRAGILPSISPTMLTTGRLASSTVNLSHQIAQAPVLNQEGILKEDIKETGRTIGPIDQSDGVKQGDHQGKETQNRNVSLLHNPSALSTEGASSRTSFINSLGAVPQQVEEGQQVQTFKTFLLQLLQNSTLNKQVKDKIQTLIQTVQGQQILLATEAQQPIQTFAFQAFYPFGADLRSVYGQISGKRGKKGTVDPENCRLFFHLDLQKLGETEIDVSIQSRYVSITFYSLNVPAEGRAWLKESEEQVKEALFGLGYSLTSMTWREIQLQPNPPTSTTTLTRTYTQAPVQGVDIRL